MLTKWCSVAVALLSSASKNIAVNLMKPVALRSLLPDNQGYQMILINNEKYT